MNDQHQNQSGGPKKPFRLDISFEDSDFDTVDLGTLDDMPRSKGEVYFANPPQKQQQTAAPAKPPRKRHTGVVILMLLAVSAGVAVFLSILGISALRDIFALGRSPQDVHVSIPASLTTNEVIDVLAEKQLIHQTAICKLFSEFTYYMRSKNVENPKTPEYLAGEYDLNTGMGLEEMLNTFKAQPKTSETTSLLFQEGYTVKQIINKLNENRVTGADTLKRTMMSTEFDYSFLKDLPTKGRYYKYEGYLFPDTYEFFINENASSALTRFFENFQKKWSEGKFAARAKEMEMTIDEVVTLASIIQKEAADESQMKDVSGVLHNRLHNASVYPLLECDSTRDYVTNNIATEMDAGAAAYYNDLYNTYKCPGLPVGPICSPSLDAIDAALNPNDHSYYYFQHDKAGKIYLSKTKSEHNSITMDLVIKGLSQ